MSYIINWKTHLKCILLSMLITIIFYNQFYNIIGNFLGCRLFEYFNFNTIIQFYIYIILIMIPVSIVHEYIHGLTFKILGGRVAYGFRGIYAYTREISGKAIIRYMFLLVLLMPLTIISLLCLILNNKVSGMIFLLNLLGSSGDIYISFTLLKYKECFIIDRKYGYDIING